VADVTISPDDFHFEVYPKDSDLLTKIALAIKTSHPEFKQEVKSVDENPDDSSDDGKYLLLQMPEVDDDRHDLLVNGVGALYDECKVKLDTNFQAYTTKITAQLVGCPAEELDEAKAALQEVNDKYAEMIKGFREEKEKEIEGIKKKNTRRKRKMREIGKEKFLSLTRG
jgi:ribosome recycling factor